MWRSTAPPESPVTLDESHVVVPPPLNLALAAGDYLFGCLVLYLFFLCFEAGPLEAQVGPKLAL